MWLTVDWGNVPFPYFGAAMRPEHNHTHGQPLPPISEFLSLIAQHRLLVQPDDTKGVFAPLREKTSQLLGVEELGFEASPDICK